MITFTQNIFRTTSIGYKPLQQLKKGVKNLRCGSTMTSKISRNASNILQLRAKVARLNTANNKFQTLGYCQRTLSFQKRFETFLEEENSIVISSIFSSDLFLENKVELAQDAFELLFENLDKVNRVKSLLNMLKLQKYYLVEKDKKAQNEIVVKLIQLLKEGKSQGLDDYPKLLAQCYELIYLNDKKLIRYLNSELSNNFEVFKQQIDFKSSARILELISSKQTLDGSDLGLIVTLSNFLNEFQVFLGPEEVLTIMNSILNIEEKITSMKSNAQLQDCKLALNRLLSTKFTSYMKKDFNSNSQDLITIFLILENFSKIKIQNIEENDLSTRIQDLFINDKHLKYYANLQQLTEFIKINPQSSWEQSKTILEKIHSTLKKRFSEPWNTIYTLESYLALCSYVNKHVENGQSLLINPKNLELLDYLLEREIMHSIVNVNYMNTRVDLQLLRNKIDDIFIEGKEENTSLGELFKIND